MGEAGCDYGWVESENGDIITGQKNNNVVCAGGNTNNQIQIVIDTLSRGKYRLRYISYESESYSAWGGHPNTIFLVSKKLPVPPFAG
jgi:hypothetical protein